MREPEQPGQEVPAFLLLELAEVGPDRYAELVEQLADIPYRRVPKALVEAVGNLTLPSPEFDHEPDPVEKRALVDFARRTLSEHAAIRSVGTLWNDLLRQWQWAIRSIANIRPKPRIIQHCFYWPISLSHCPMIAARKPCLTLERCTTFSFWPVLPVK